MYFDHFLTSTFVKIHQNWLVWPILPVKKKGRHFLEYFSKGNFRRKQKVHFWIRTTLTKWTFSFIIPIFMIFMQGRLNTYYFLDFENILQKKGEKGYYGHFGTLLDLCPDWQKWLRYQNVHNTLFYPFFAKIFQNLKSNMYLLYPP